MWLVRDSKSYSMRDRRATTKKNRKSFMDTIMPTYAMAHRGKNRAPMPLPGQQDSPSDAAAPPPLPARRPPPAPPSQTASHPVHVTKLNAAEESDEDDSYEEPSTARLNMSLQEIYDDFDDLLEDFPPSSTPPLPPPPPPFANSRKVAQDSQEIYDDFEEEERPPISPYNPIQEAPQEIYDDFEEEQQGEIYEDADDCGPEVTVLSPPSQAPPLPSMEGRRRGSQPPLPPVPSNRKDPSPAPVQDIYETTEDLEIDEDSPVEEAPTPPPLPSGRPKPPPPQRKAEEKKTPVVPKIGLGPIGQADIQGVLKGLRKVSRDEKTEDKNNNDKKKVQSESLPFPVQLKKTPFEEKSKESPKENGSSTSEIHHGNGNATNSNKPIPPIKDLKPKPLIPKIPPVESNVSKAPKFPPVKTDTDVSKPKETKSPPKPGVPLKPSPSPRPPISPKTPTENGGVKTILLTPRKLPPPSPVEDFPPPPPPEEFDPEDIYDDAFSQDLDPLSKFPWYHGKVERKDCDKMLRNIGTDGTFLVRKSTQGNVQPYTMAVLYQDRVNNLKVRRRDDARIALGDPKDNEISFKDVEGMVEHHKKHPVLLIGRQKGEITLGEYPKKK